MRLFLLTVIAAATTVAVPDPMVSGYSAPAQKWRSVDDAQVNCEQVIAQVRDTGGQPTLDRTPATAEQPLLIAAVDKRIHGCPVLQMRADANDLRPVPRLADSPPRVQPAQ